MVFRYFCRPHSLGALSRMSSGWLESGQRWCRETERRDHHQLDGTKAPIKRHVATELARRSSARRPRWGEAARQRRPIVFAIFLIVSSSDGVRRRDVERWKIPVFLSFAVLAHI